MSCPVCLYWRERIAETERRVWDKGDPTIYAEELRLKAQLREHKEERCHE